MNEEQEVRATGAMPGLESLVNSIKELRFKVFKLSTYNSWIYQLQLKDTIISNCNEANKKLICDANIDKQQISVITNERNSLRVRLEKFININQDQEKIIFDLSEKDINNEKIINSHKVEINSLRNSYSSLLEKYNKLRSEHSRENQPRVSGKFAKK